MEDGGAYNNASSNINTGSCNYIEEIMQSSLRRLREEFRESIDLLHSSMAQRIEKVEEEVRSLKSTLEDVLTLNEIVGERKVTEDSKIKSSHVFNDLKIQKGGQLQKMQAFKQEVAIPVMKFPLSLDQAITMRDQRRITTPRYKTMSLKICECGCEEWKMQRS